ncbi:deleted in lung and esophageal cancer protein 1 isoform X2 [Hemicordylus capensis]|uniref:deleted in lung and esophageal cancer protein 1 isoform X2 n=1 Tax=Hemicordylus capensis TaxID=884348 RepID=UPI0023034A95|nr:deleted in lung and esophageal cancer protein 1 isoform X2 [Hemicordylus capensis]
MLPSEGKAVGIMARQSPEPSMYRHRPTSELAQDISHLLTKVFKNLYTAEVIGADTVENMIKSRGGNNAHHEKFVEELQKVHSEYNNRLKEAEMLERHIIQARARATAEEERVLNLYKAEVPEEYRQIALPPVKSSFRWCVDDELLKKHNLICPEDYITDADVITRAPKDVSEPGYLQEILSFKQHVAENISAPKFKESVHITKILENLPEVSLSSLTLESSAPGIPNQTRKPFYKKSKPPRKPAWMNDMTKAERVKDRAYLQKLEERHNFLKNPRFFPPNTQRGSRSLLLPQKKVERLVAGRKKIVVESNSQSVPIFLANPPAVLFSYYEVGQVYEMTVELQNMTSTSQCVRIIPPATSAFSIGLGIFPGEGGLVAPGMSCHYTVQFIPEHLADYEDYILVETQSAFPLLVPLKGQRPPPILTLPRVLDCGACLVGGIKFTEFPCKNEGSSVGKFCIMPKKMWPPLHFRAVATFGFVEQEPFGIRPAVFELAPGQSASIEVVFAPIFAEDLSVVYTIACDNCQINDITVTGLGQLIGLKLLSVTGGESSPIPGELTDVTAQHLVRFESLNPYSMAEKTLVLRNITHVELPFFWQIMKPNLQSLTLEGKVDLGKIKYIMEKDSAFSITPAMGVLHPHADHSFTLSYLPKELKEYHSVLQIVLEDIPELPSFKKLTQYDSDESQAEDVIALEIDLKGQTEPFQLILEPYAIFIPGENYIGINIRRTFQMYNNSKSSVKFVWERISNCDIIEVVPPTGKIRANEHHTFEFIITGGKPGHSTHDMLCTIVHSAEPVVLHVEADFKGPVLSIDTPSLDLGLIKLGRKVLCTFEIANLSQLTGKWKMQESPACLAERNEETSPFTIQPSNGELGPLEKCSVSVSFWSNVCQRIQTVLEMEVENGDGSHIPVFVEVQTPHVCLLSSHLEFDLSLGIPSTATVTLFNQTLLPTRFTWGKLFGRQASSCVFSISPENGSLGPNEEKDFFVELTTNTKDKLSELTLCCSIEDMLDPLFLAISGEVKGLEVTYYIPSDSDEEQNQEDSPELKLDFGSEVALKSVVKRQLIITNRSALSAFFTIEVDYFRSSPPPPNEEEPNVSLNTVAEKARRITRQIVKRKQSAFRATMLSQGKGAAFHVHPSSGILKAFQELVVEITAYNNMWGEYHDILDCKVGESDPVLIPMHMSVKGCPIFLQLTGPNHPMPIPIIRFGAHISGGDTVSRYIRLNNPTPFDIRMDWESYNQDKDDDKLVDLLVFYGPPFPIKDLDGNEIKIWDIETPEDKTSQTSCSASLTSHKDNQSLDPILESDETSDSDSFRPPTPRKIISVVIRPHEGVPSDYPFCITPKQIVIPAGGAAAVHISFTPLMLPEIINKFECEGFALGFMSLDTEFDRKTPEKVTRGDGHAVAPLRIDLQAFVKPALLTVEMDHESGLVFHAVASDLIPDEPIKACQVLIDFATTHNLKLTNDTETPLYFKLVLSMPFAVSGVDPKKSLKTSHSDRDEEGNHLLLYALENMLVKISFHTTLEILTYQHLPEDQMLPGLQVLQLENGDKMLEFRQDLVIEYSNKATQVLPVVAYLTVPVLEISCQVIDFGTCLVNQEKSDGILVMNKSKSKSYWTALLDQDERHRDPVVFSISPNNGMLEAREGNLPTTVPLLVRFTPRDSVEYETTVTIVGMLGEKPCMLHLKGRGSYDEKYEERHKT